MARVLESAGFVPWSPEQRENYYMADDWHSIWRVRVRTDRPFAVVTALEAAGYVARFDDASTVSVRL